MSRGGLLVAGLLLLGVSATSRADEALARLAVETYGTALDTADRDTRLDTFRRAERLFAVLADGGARNAELYTNLGNAALQAERLGPAVLAFRRALSLDPDHPRALQNLEHARTLLPDWVPRPEPAGLLDSVFFFHRAFTRASRSLAAAICFAAASLLVAAGLRLEKPALRAAAWLPGAAWLALVASVAVDPVARARDEAVIVADELVARAADSPLAPATFRRPLPAGVEVRIVEHRDAWVRIRLAGGRDAWVSGSGVERVAREH